MRSVETIHAPHSRFQIAAFDAFSHAALRRF
jgi:hypothetical protein